MPNPDFEGRASGSVARDAYVAAVRASDFPSYG
jgi:hypothetical protein